MISVSKMLFLWDISSFYWLLFNCSKLLSKSPPIDFKNRCTLFLLFRLLSKSWATISNFFLSFSFFSPLPLPLLLLFYKLLSFNIVFPSFSLVFTYLSSTISSIQLDSLKQLYSTKSIDFYLNFIPLKKSSSLTVLLNY